MNKFSSKIAVSVCVPTFESWLFAREFPIGLDLSAVLNPSLKSGLYLIVGFAE